MTHIDGDGVPSAKNATFVQKVGCRVWVGGFLGDGCGGFVLHNHKFRVLYFTVI